MTLKRTVTLRLVACWVVAIAPWRQAGGAEAAPHDFAQWEPEIAAMEAADHANPPPRGALLFIGSSTIRLWKTLADDFPEQRVINRGFGGSEIVDATHFAERIILPCAPRAVFLRAGGNDLNNGNSPEQVFGALREFVATIHAKLPNTEVVFISLSPSLARWEQHDREKALNALIEEYARQTPRLRYLETYDLVLGPDGHPRPELFVDDKLHLNDAGYRLLVERVRAFLRK